jgi:inner membrane protein
VLPYNKTIINDKGKSEVITNYAYFTPESLFVEGNLGTEIRKYSIFEAVLYKSKLKAKGYFNVPNLNSLNIPSANVRWQDAFISVGISDLRGINAPPTLQFEEQKLNFNAGTKVTNDANGLHAMLNLKGAIAKKQQFSIELDLKGSEGISFIPVANFTDIRLKSDWKSPSYTGNTIPDKRSDNNANGFTAEWNILGLNRNIPKQWTNEEGADLSYQVGVNLLIPVDNYAKTERAIKYALLLIVLSFLAFFAIELLSKRKVHPLQYLLIGLALVIFFTLLLSFSEYLAFNTAYIIAMLMTVGLVSWYAGQLFKDRKFITLVGGTLLTLYGFIFTMLQLEDFALLVGSVGLFVIIGLMMYLSKQIEWYKER